MLLGEEEEVMRRAVQVWSVGLILVIILSGTNSPSSFSLFNFSYLFQPAREARRLAQRAERPRRGLSALWASRRASAQAVTSKWQLRTTSPMNTNSSVGENWFLAKNRSWPGRL